MNKLFFFCVVGVCLAVGQALQCYQCSVGFWNLCITTQATCAANEQCYSGLGKAAGFLDIKKKGCLDATKCNVTENVNFPSTNSNATLYKMTKTCCNTDLCNAAPGTSCLSLMTGIFSALIATKMLI